MMTINDQLIDYDLCLDPTQNFLTWYEKAKSIEENPEAMTLATSDLNGSVAARIVLFKGISSGKFTLYGHDCSLKGRQMAENPQAAVVFYWHNLKRQVRVSGVIQKMPLEQVDDYFQKRGLESQVASSISVQSKEISSRNELETLFNQALSKAKKEGRVDRPATWTGYYLEPKEYEFFLYREHRLNDRFLFSKMQQGWSVKRLQP